MAAWLARGFFKRWSMTFEYGQWAPDVRCVGGSGVERELVLAIRRAGRGQIAYWEGNRATITYPAKYEDAVRRAIKLRG